MAACSALRSLTVVKGFSEIKSCLLSRCIVQKVTCFIRNHGSKRELILHKHPEYRRWKIIGLDRSKPLTMEPLPVHSTGGRGPDGRLWVHNVGGGMKRVYLQVDFRRITTADGKELIERVHSILPDPMRSAHIAIVAGGERKRYILATENMKVGDLITSSTEIPLMPVKPVEGNAHPLGALPVGTLVSNVEKYPEAGGTLCRAAGTYGVIVRKIDDRVIIKIPSKREINVSKLCIATVGRMSNINHHKEHIGSPQMLRWLGYRPRSGWWHRKTGYNGRKIRPIPPMKIYTKPPEKSSDIFTFT